LLAVYGKKDAIVSPDHAQFLNEMEGRPYQLIVLPKANHFPFLEQSNTFNRLLLDFLISTGTPVEIKAEWRRRVKQHEYL
ncbi:MAG: alpha/beta hydrolase, partial [Chloroflexales bacterium]|nr:alpha/beta hydrolase [Chloroflexales bacterium]